MVSRRSMLAKVDGVNNAVFLVGDKIGTQMFYERGAGAEATGAAVVSDLIEIARDLTAGHLSAKNSRDSWTRVTSKSARIPDLSAGICASP